MNALADRTDSRRPQLSRRFIDNGHRVGMRDLLLGHLPPGAQGYAKGMRIIRADQFNIDVARILLRLATDGISGPRPSEWQTSVAHGYRSHARQVDHGIQHALREGDTLFIGWITLGRQLEVDHQDAVGLKSEIQMLQIEESPDGEARAHQQDHGKRNLGDYERSARTSARAARKRTAGILQRFD